MGETKTGRKRGREKKEGGRKEKPEPRKLGGLCAPGAPQGHFPLWLGLNHTCSQSLCFVSTTAIFSRVTLFNISYILYFPEQVETTLGLSPCIYVLPQGALLPGKISTDGYLMLIHINFHFRNVHLRGWCFSSLFSPQSCGSITSEEAQLSSRSRDLTYSINGLVSMLNVFVCFMCPDFQWLLVTI